MSVFSSIGSDGKGRDGLQGYLAKLANDHPKLAKRAKAYAQRFAAVGYGPPVNTRRGGS
jgi:hypothetical protein